MIAVGEHDVPRMQCIEQAAKQRLLGALFPAAWPHRPIEHRGVAKREDRHQARHWKPQSRLLTAALGKGRLIARGVGHRNRCAIEQFHRTPAPAPAHRLCAFHACRHCTLQRPDQAQRQPLTRLAVGAGIQTALRCPACGALAQVTRYGVLASTVGTQRLTNEQSQRSERRINPVSISSGVLPHQTFKRMRPQHIAQRLASTLHKLLAKPPDLILQTFFW